MSDPAGDPLADAIAAAIHRGRTQQDAFDNPPPGHVHGPECNPVWQTTLVTKREPLLILLIHEDPDSPSGIAADIKANLPPQSVAAALRLIADQWERQQQAGLS
jgi:hypothetical protein